MSKTSEIKFACEFCNREFVRETTLYKHVCETKRRWNEKDAPTNRIAYNCWLDFINKNAPNKKQKSHRDFIKSPYYTAFVKFAIYCIDVGAINNLRYADWLIKNQIRIDTWASDTNYTKFLVEYLRQEDPYDALKRSLEHTMMMAEEANILAKDYLKYGNKNRICYAVTLGKVSPWMLYQCNSGIAFLESLDETQVALVIDYINPQLWSVRFKRYQEIASDIKAVLTQLGY